MRVMIAVTHLLGTGHLARALTLARAYLAAGDSATVVTGGVPVPQLDRGDVPLVQLPPLRSDGIDFSRLLDAEGILATPALFAKRQALLLKTLAAMKPDIVITELYPFGRRILQAEFTALLEAAAQMQPRALVCASVRDILAAPSKPAKAARTEEIIAQSYGAVLVHGDPDLIALDASWPVTPAIAAKLHYTGYIAPPPVPPHPDDVGAGEILVTAGGGPVGGRVFDAAAEAARLRPDLRWRLLGHDLPPLPGNAIAEPPRADFRQVLAHAAASVSLCGYNTALDVLRAGVPAVFVPFDGGGETEQTQRAEALAGLRAIETIRAADVTGAALLAALGRVMPIGRRAQSDFAADGAARTVDITHQLRDKGVC